MRYINSRLRGSLFILSLFTLLLASCEDDPATFGVDILPSTDMIYAAIDSQKISSTNMLPHEILSDGYSKKANSFLGIYNDPKLGITKADFVAELNIAAPVDSFDFDGINFSPDSAVLNLLYHNNAWYGNKLSKIEVKVYELTERLEPELPYLSNYQIEGKYNPQAIGSKIITPYANKNDSVWNVHKSDTIKIKLSEEFTQKLFELKNISTDNKEERDKFKDLVNGIYVTVNDDVGVNSNGALLTIDILNTLSNVTLHYKKEIYDISSDQLLGMKYKDYKFPISRSGRIFNRFTHELSDNILLENVESERLFIQGLAGTYTKIDLADIYQQWKDSVKNIIEENKTLEISGVDLIFYADTAKTELEKSLYLPFQNELAILTKNADGSFTEPLHKVGESNMSAFHSGGVAKYNRSENSFKFAMSKDYFIDIINNNADEEELYLKLPLSPFNYKRVVLYNNDSAYHPRIKIRYVKF